MTPDALLDALNIQIAALAAIALVGAGLAMTAEDSDTRWMAAGAAMMILGYSAGRAFWAFGDELWPHLLERTDEARAQRLWIFVPTAQLTVAGGVCMVRPLLEDWFGRLWFAAPYAGSLVILAASAQLPH